MEKLKVAFLGGAVDSAVGQVHRVAIDMDRRYELVAGCFSREPDVNAATAKEYAVADDKVFPGLQELLDSEAGNLDAIIILTPTDQHKDQVVRCLDAGVPVICEKALAASSADIEEIKAAREKNNGYLSVTYNYTGYPMLRELKRAIEKGGLGAIKQIHLEMPQEGFAKLTPDGNPITPQNWRLRDQYVPTISLDLGVHLHLMVGFLTGDEPEELVAVYQSVGQFSEIVDNVMCTANYSNGLVTNIWYSKTALGCRNGLRVRVFGTEGSAEWVQEDPEYLHLADKFGRISRLDRGGPEVEISNQQRYTRFKAGHPAGFIEAFANYYCDIADQLDARRSSNSDAGNEYVFGVDDALEGMRMLEAITESSQEKKWVSLNG